jgi:hypothetical protein
MTRKPKTPGARLVALRWKRTSAPARRDVALALNAARWACQSEACGHSRAVHGLEGCTVCACSAFWERPARASGER